MSAFSSFLSHLSYGWILLMLGLVLVLLHLVFGLHPRTKAVRGQLLVLCGMDLVALLFYVLTFSLRISKLARETGATPRTMPRLWFYLMVPVSLLAFYAILSERNKPDKPLGRWVYSLLVGIGALLSVLLFPLLGYYLSSAIFLFLVMFSMGERNRLQLLLVPVGWCLFTYAVFDRLLYIRLPIGALFSAFLR